VLLDVDGTLIDSSYLHTVAWFRALRDHGSIEPMARLHRLVGMGADMYTKAVAGEERQDLADSHSRRIKELRSDMVGLPGAGELIRRIHAAGLEVVLSTSASPDDVDSFMRMLGVEGLIDSMATGEDVAHTKPAPDVVAVALEKSGLNSENAVFVGDTRWDVEAAGRAGVPCIAVESGGWAPDELREAGAVAVYKDPGELAARFDESPLGELARRA
jgi:HAD superfamily hydrolase (TIGR01509 family)